MQPASLKKNLQLHKKKQAQICRKTTRLATLLQQNLPQMLVLLTEIYAMIQVSILLQLHRTVVANFLPNKFGLLGRNPWQLLAEP